MAACKSVMDARMVGKGVPQEYFPFRRKKFSRRGHSIRTTFTLDI
ncbi:hypothetical protein GGE12_000485 [Rhizobium mongolense]|uniref:Uncharacterized protein n=1 Tax=Rhizobium mongolense TaxID=57676 RepID=A0A7W6RHS3_9HYPH|nr:hypothetical protein [Rhizobium mongolense]